MDRSGQKDIELVTRPRSDAIFATSFDMLPEALFDVAPDTSPEVQANLPDLGPTDAVPDAPTDAQSDMFPEVAGDLVGDSSSSPLCLIGPQNAICIHETTTLLTGFSGLVPRDVHWQLPLGLPPPTGWPAAILFQGSFLPAGFFWSTFADAPFAIWQQVVLVKSLLDAGFAVITPEAHVEGGTYWDTNIPPYTLFWETAPDHFFMLDILTQIDGGGFGPIDTDRMYAGGFSSGGYMTSRMAVSYPGVFKALAIQSASYATCAGPTCFVPDLPEDHPPTVFLHGGLDTTVPLHTMESYAEKLEEQGTEVAAVIDPSAGHEWLESAPTLITGWYQSH